MKKVLQNIRHILNIIHLVFTSINAVERKQSMCDHRVIYIDSKNTSVKITVTTIDRNPQILSEKED